VAQEKIAAIIAAAGGSKRMAGIDKLFASLCGRPVLAYTLEAFLAVPVIQQIVLVLSERNRHDGQALVDALDHRGKDVRVCLGGQQRQDSVRQGLAATSGVRWVVIHDGARPLVTVEIILAGLREAQATGAAVAAVPVKDTVKVVDPVSFSVRETLPRSELWAVQTPQVFRYDLIALAHREAVGEVTDDASLIEQLGGVVRVYTGSYENIKITTTEDLLLADQIVRKRSAG